MSSFSRFDAFCHFPGTDRTYILQRLLLWEIGAKGSGWDLKIYPGTTFDISVPWWLRWLVSPHDRRILPAAAVHDELLRLGHDTAFASAEFRRALIARGAGKAWAWALFFATLVVTTVNRRLKA